jgi:hypothetical protein
MNSKIYFGEYTFTPRALQLPFYNNPEIEALFYEFYKSRVVNYEKIKKFILYAD